MLALIAGRGALPAAVAEAASTPVCVAALEGFWPDRLVPEPDLIWRIETLGTLLFRMTQRGVTEVCLCGAVERPHVNMAAIDDRTRALIPVMHAALQDKGDDGVLRAVIGIFEDAGFAVRAAHEVAPRLLPPSGVLTEAKPGPGAERDAHLGDAVSQQQGQDDLGQACVIRDGQVIAREGTCGTDVMLADVAKRDVDVITGTLDGLAELLQSAADWLSETTPKGAGMFFKAPKPGQDHRADLPVIGPHTVDAVAKAGLAGITIAAGGVMVLQQDEVIARCNAQGLYLWVRDQ